MILQGLVILVVGLAIVFAFLLLLVLIMTAAGKILPRFTHLLPDDQSKPKKSRGVHAEKSERTRDNEEAIAVAIAVASAQKQKYTC